jgi:hypothetical protein
VAKAQPKGAVRQRLADDANEDYELIRNALKDAAQSKKQVWISCPHCKKKSQVEIADGHAAAKAAQIWLEQGFGRAADSTKRPDEGPPDLGKPVEAMTAAERDAYARFLIAENPELAEEFTVEKEKVLAGVEPALEGFDD